MTNWKNIRRFLSEINTENLSTANKQAVEDLRNFAERYNRKEYQAKYRERHRDEIREYLMDNLDKKYYANETLDISSSYMLPFVHP